MNDINNKANGATNGHLNGAVNGKLLRFPEQFLWGTATSTTQIEGAERVLVTGGLGVPTSALILTKGH